jgi:hypothetical protein
VIIGCSIFIPLIATGLLVWVYLRNWRDDPDEQRLKRVQAEYRARRDPPGSPRR